MEELDLLAVIEDAGGDVSASNLITSLLLSSPLLSSPLLSSPGITRKNPRTPLSDLQGTNALNEKASW